MRDGRRSLMILEIDPAVTLDPWSHREEDVPIPRKAKFVCAHELPAGFGSVEEALYYLDSKDTEELWSMGNGAPLAPQLLEGAHNLYWAQVVDKRPPRRLVWREKQGGPPVGCLDLLRQLVVARVGYLWPGGFLGGGIIEEPEYLELINAIEAQLDENQVLAREQESPIVQVARDLELNPEPEGTAPQRWWANCPGTGHRLMISTDSDSFGCGYCARKGGVEELRIFVEERRSRA